MDVTAKEANKKRKGKKSPTDEEEVGGGPGETRPATRERMTSPRQGRQRSLLDAMFGRAGEGTSVGGRQVRGDRRSAQEGTRRELQGPSQRQEASRDASLPVVHAPSHSDESRRRQYFSPGALRGEQHTPGKEPEGS